MQSDGIASENRLETVHVQAGIDGLGVGERIAVLPMVEADVCGAAANAVASVAPILCAALRERRKLHVDEAA